MKQHLLVQCVIGSVLSCALTATVLAAAPTAGSQPSANTGVPTDVVLPLPPPSPTGSQGPAMMPSPSGQQMTPPAQQNGQMTPPPAGSQMPAPAGGSAPMSNPANTGTMPPTN